MLLRSAATTFILLLASLPAHAQSVSASDPEGIVQVFQDLGYRATLEKADDGDPLVRSAADGTNFRIWFYGCDDSNSNCNSMNFSAGFDLEKGSSLETIDAWNDNQLLGYGSLDDESDPFLNYFVVTNGGISREAFESILSRWESAVVDFKAHIGFE